ncbi:MAG: glycosyltransferase family 2 protein [Muribaculaceae bacterium]|nr:glycosyltransferase family 2 protein [Muribaculaceae bacterium]
MTIVVPVYNRPALIVRCLDSLKSQSYRPLHVIVVDNVSTDDTLPAVEKWKEENETADFLIETLSESKAGAAHARQTGLERVDTEKVMFFDSDDVMRPECVAEVMTAWRREKEADIVAWPITFRRDEGSAETHSIKGNLIERHLVHAIFRTQGYAVKTSFIKSCGGWRGEFPVWNDFETGARLILHEPVVVAIDRSLVDVYPQAESITGLSFSSKQGKWEKSLDAIDGTIDQSGHQDRNRLHNIVTYRRAILAAFYAREGHPEFAMPLYLRALREIPKKKRPLIRFAYHWTRLGMRGAFSIVGKFL